MTRCVPAQLIVFVVFFFSIASSAPRCADPPSVETPFLGTFSGNVNALAFMNNGKMLITAGGSSKDNVLGPGELIFWDVASGRQVSHQKQHLFFISAMAVCTEGKLIATGAANGEIKVLTSQQKSAVATFNGHKGQIASLSFSTDGSLLASTSEFEPPRAMGEWHQSIVKVWDVTAGKEVASFQVPRTKRFIGFLNAALSPDGRSLAVTPGDNTVRILDATSGKDLKIIREEKADLIPVLFARDGKTLFSGFGSREKRITAWDVNTGTERYSLSSRNVGILSCLSLSEDGQLLAIGGHDGIATIWDLATRKEKLAVTVEKEIDVLKHIHLVALSRDGKMLATSPGASLYGRCSVKLWDAQTGKEIAPGARR